jgi:hypothetical protein
MKETNNTHKVENNNSNDNNEDVRNLFSSLYIVTMVSTIKDDVEVEIRST